MAGRRVSVKISTENINIFTFPDVHDFHGIPQNKELFLKQQKAASEMCWLSWQNPQITNGKRSIFVCFFLAFGQEILLAKYK